jgi:hypothetical protein
MTAMPSAEVMAAARSLAERACADQGLPVVIEDPTVLALVARLLDERERDPVSVERLTAAHRVRGDFD